MGAAPHFSSLATFPLCTVYAWVFLSSPHPSPALGPHLGTRLMGKLTPYFFPQVPPGAAETPKAPGTSELHGGHLQGTGILWERRGRLGPWAEKSGPRIGKEPWPGPGTHRHSIKVCGWMNEWCNTEFLKVMHYTERSLLNLKKKMAQRTPVFGFKLFLLSTYLHVNGYKIPSNSDSYTIIKPKQIYKPSPNTHGKTNKMQTHNPGMGKGDCLGETQSLLLL